MAAISSGALWVIIALAVLVGLVLLYFAMLFVTATLERNYVRPLRAVPDHRIPNDAVPRIGEAVALGFKRLGVYSDGDKGLKEGLISLLLSPDGSELVWILHSKLIGRKQVITRLDDDRWLVTADMLGVADLSGLRDEAMLPEASLEAILLYHRDRRAWARQGAAPFTPASVIDDIYRHALDRAEVMYEAGLIRYRTPRPIWTTGFGDEAVYTYTSKGAGRLVAENVVSLMRTPRQLELKKQIADGLRRTHAEAHDRPTRSRD